MALLALSFPILLVVIKRPFIRGFWNAVYLSKWLTLALLEASFLGAR
jgi:hypothetical protein